jgi:hypothetical protein
VCVYERSRPDPLRTLFAVRLQQTTPEKKKKKQRWDGQTWECPLLVEERILWGSRCDAETQKDGLAQSSRTESTAETRRQGWGPEASAARRVGSARAGSPRTCPRSASESSRRNRRWSGTAEASAAAARRETAEQAGKWIACGPPAGRTPENSRLSMIRRQPPTSQNSKHIASSNSRNT